ncbi:hypothetical protein [Mycobacterium sp. TY813]|uniref:hypothetical protein n=1 Tax=Mycobacterium TaxID=1763 RepID=UPI002741FA9B|nr:hypothetical protein [Mycobacterium sp. TY813]MDP7731510.1 hypothetical protein [Mycobacterium sp. TY813]
MVRARARRRAGGRDRGSDGNAVVVPGVYSALRELAQADWDNPHDWDPRWKHAAHSGNPIGQWCGTPGVVCEHDPPPVEYRDPCTRVRLEQFEAGEPVLMRAAAMPGGMLPPGDRGAAYRVGPDDTVTIKT